MSELSKWTLLAALLFLSFTSVSGQSRSQLEAERLRLIEKIELAEGQIKRAKASTNTSLDEFHAITAQIASRNKLIVNLKKQLDDNINLMQINSDSIAAMETEIVNLTHSYGEMLRLAHLRQRGTNRWISIFSANTLNEAILMWRYSSQYQTYIDAKKKEVAYLKESIESKNQLIAQKQQETQQLLEDEKRQSAKLESIKVEKTEIVENLKKQESVLKKEQNKIRQEREAVNKKIEETIVTSIKKETTNIATKKNLPWPVGKGYITQGFGRVQHPTLPDQYIDNNGVDIQSEPTAPVHSILQGKVLGITKSPGQKNMVIIDHEGIQTIFSMLESVDVSKGQNVSKGTVIGKLGKAGKLHFEIWVNREKQDPTQWIEKR